MRRGVLPLAAAGLIAVGVFRIVSTYPVFNQTWDEPAHIAAGMEWLSRGSYTYEPLHPPLARVMVALGPYLDGLRSVGHENTWLEGNSLLHAGGRYYRNLSLARLGVLPFFVLAAVVVLLWTRKLFGDATAIVAALLFTTLPPVLAHSGIATTDAALTGTLALALYALWRWLEQPSGARGLALGVSVAGAVLSKLSALLFLPAGGLAIVLCHRRASRDNAHGQHSPGSRLTAMRVAYLSAIVAVWAGYRFSVGPLVTEADQPLESRPGAHGEHSALYRAAYDVSRASIYPAPEFFQGLSMLYRKNQAGQKAYLLGEVRMDGWWYFFPVALAVKTPIPFLLLFGIGLGAVLSIQDRASRWRSLAPAAAAGAILLVSLPSRINIGLRHVLPMYVLMAVLAGWGAVTLWRWRKAGLLGPAVVVRSWPGRSLWGYASIPIIWRTSTNSPGDTPKRFSWIAIWTMGRTSGAWPTPSALGRSRRSVWPMPARPQWPSMICPEFVGCPASTGHRLGGSESVVPEARVLGPARARRFRLAREVPAGRPRRLFDPTLSHSQVEPWEPRIL